MIDCTPKEISDAVDEIFLRLNGKWIDNDLIISLQNKFKNHKWQNIYRLMGTKKNFYHGEIKSSYSSKFLLNNKSWLD